MTEFNRPSTIIAKLREYHEKKDDEGFDLYIERLTVFELVTLRRYTDLLSEGCTEELEKREKRDRDDRV